MKKINQTPAISFIARSGTGKTTLLTAVIADLKGRGYKVGVIKHDAHRFEIDHPGKDSYRFTAAGADSMLISSASKLALVKQHSQSPPVEELIEGYFPDVDLVLVEGFKQSGLPKIELFRSGHSTELLAREIMHNEQPVAIATDTALDSAIPLLDLNKPAEVTDFILAQLGLNR